jgi:hypothetical protein
MAYSATLLISRLRPCYPQWYTDTTVFLEQRAILLDWIIKTSTPNGDRIETIAYH